MTAPTNEIIQWRPRIGKAIEQCGTHVRAATIVAETTSTQDEARARNTAPGAAIVAVRQTAGRGRFGRHWSGDPDQGVYVSLVQPFDDAPRRAVAAAVAVADTLHPHVVELASIGIKWPNDVLVRPNGESHWRKIAGVLVEQKDDRAIIGVGINVNQIRWPGELARIAIALHAVNDQPARIDVLEALLPQLDRALAADHDDISHRFTKLDVVTGTRITARCGNSECTGIVTAIDPLRGVQMQCDGEIHPRWLAAASTTLHQHPGAALS